MGLAGPLSEEAHGPQSSMEPEPVDRPGADVGHGSVDVVGRILAAKLTENLGQQVIVDNRSGASGIIGTEFVARSPADGYTLLINTLPLVTNQFLMPKVGYDAIKDFEPIMMATSSPSFVTVHPSVPARTIKELIALAKANPGKLNYASGGPGSTSHFAVAMFIALAGIQDITVHVPFRGGGPAMTATIANDTQFFFSPIAGMVPFVEAGSVRALAISGDARSPALPNVPTIAEAGMPQYKAVGWFGLMAPAGTPKEIITRLNEAIEVAVKDKDVVAALRAQGIEPKYTKPAEFGAFVAEQLELHKKLVKDVDLKIAD